MANLTSVGSQEFDINSLSAESYGEALDTNFKFMSLDLFENWNQLPFFRLKLTVNADDETQQLMSSITDFKFSYSSKQKDASNTAQIFDVYLGVNTFLKENTSGAIIYTFEGWCTKQSNFRKPFTRYLGNNALDALISLDIIPDPNHIIIDDNGQNQFFQINQTNVDMALSICKYLAKSPFWSIGLMEINLNKIPYRIDEIPGVKGTNLLVSGKIEKHTASPFFNQWKTKGGEYSYPFDFAGGDFVQALGTPHIYRIATKDQSIKRYNLFLDEYLSSGFDVSCEYHTDKEFPFPVGTVLTDSLFSVKNVSYWIIASIHRYYSHQQTNKPSISSDVQFVGVNNALESV